MSLSHVEVAIDWAAAEGWNPGLHDAQCFFAIDPRGFYMAMLDERMIASGAVPIYDAEFAFIGLYIVAPEFRGQGYGLALTKFMLAYAGNRNVGLDVMAERYARLGFRTAHRSVRLAFTPNGTTHVAAEIVPLMDVPFAELAAYDRRYFFAPRDNFLKAWIAQPQAVALGFVDAGRLKGYGVLRKCRSGYKIGSLFAEQPEIAESLFDALCNHAVGDRSPSTFRRRTKPERLSPRGTRCSRISPVSGCISGAIPGCRSTIFSGSPASRRAKSRGALTFAAPQGSFRSAYP
jgi:GNAT superfamily N-acetyltransferase